MYGYDDFDDEDDYADLDGIRERSEDPFDDLRITDEQLWRLFSLLTGNGMDCALIIRSFGARIIWVWTALDKAGKTRYFEHEINVPRRRPMDFSVVGRAANPGYRYESKRAASRAKVVDAVLRAMGAVLKVPLAGYDPDPERSRYFHENRAGR
jgi:hypothetical protein